jgi:hypothetical protein
MSITQQQVQETVFRLRQWKDLSEQEQRRYHPGECAYIHLPEYVYLLEGFNKFYYSKNATIDHCEICKALFYTNETINFGVIFGLQYAFDTITRKEEAMFVDWVQLYISKSEIGKDLMVVFGESHYTLEFKESGTNMFARRKPHTFSALIKNNSTCFLKIPESGWINNVALRREI